MKNSSIKSLIYLISIISILSRIFIIKFINRNRNRYKEGKAKIRDFLYK